MQKLFQIAQCAGITVEYCNIPRNRSLSVQDDGGDFVLMDYSLIGSGAAERVHLGHEIGHSVKGAFYNPYAPLDVRQKQEKKADKWAIETLVPLDAFDEAVADGCASIWELAERFGVTEAFMRKAVCWHLYGNLDESLYF